MKFKKHPRDLNQLAKSIVDFSMEEKKSDKNPHAVALGRLGGIKGGKARADKLTKNQRIKIARKAAKTRWSKKKK